MKLAKTVAALALAGSLAACGKLVTVEPGYVGKLNTSSGLKENVIYPSKFRLNGPCWVCDSLILLEASDRRVKEDLQIFMPKDQLNIQVAVIAVLAIETRPEVVDPIFARIPSAPIEGQKRQTIITFNRVYTTYGQQAIQDTVRSVLVKYSINQLMENRDMISAEINQAVTERLKGTPLKVLRIGFADIQFPSIIVKAKERAAEREAAIAEAENRKAVALKEQEIQLIEAETQMLVDQKLAAGVSRAFMAQRWLAVWDKLASNQQKTIIVVTPEAMADPSIMAPTLNRAIANSGN